MKNKIFALIVAVCVFALAALPALAEQEQGVLYVGGTLVTAENANDVFGDGTVSYDAASKTLTLDGINITGTYEYAAKMFAAIYATDDLCISVKSSSRVTPPESSGCSVGICALGKLDIVGTGSFIVMGGNVVTDLDDAVVESTGIIAVGGLTVDGIDLHSSGGDVAANNGEGYASSVGVYICGDLVEKSGASLLLDAGKTEAYYSYSCGLQSYNGDIHIDNCYLSCSGGEAMATFSAASVGISVDCADINILGERSTAYLYGSVSESAQNNYSLSCGVYICGGDINIGGGNIAVKVFGSSDQSCNYYGIQAQKTLLGRGGNINIETGKIYLKQNGISFYGVDINITTPDGGTAIYADGEVTLADNVSVRSPKNSKLAAVSNVEGEFAYNTVTDAEGNIACSADIALLTYTIKFINAKYTLGFDVPVGMSANTAYEVDDLAELIGSQKEGYEIVGWYTDEACTDGNEYDFDTAVSADITLYPKYAEIQDEPVVPPTGDSGVTAALAVIAISALLIAFICKYKRRSV